MEYVCTNELYHHGIKGQKWGVRRYQNLDGSLTDAGKRREARYLQKEANRQESRNAMTLYNWNKASDKKELKSYKAHRLMDKLDRRSKKGKDTERLEKKVHKAIARMNKAGDVVRKYTKEYNEGQKKVWDILDKAYDQDYAVRSKAHNYAVSGFATPNYAHIVTVRGEKHRIKYQKGRKTIGDD